MYLHDENLELINSDELIRELLEDKTLLEGKKISSKEAEELLLEWYNKSDYFISNILFSRQYLIMFEERRFLRLGDLLKKLKKIVCRIIKDTSTAEDIISAILEGIAVLIPGGVVIKTILKKIVKYFLERGYQKICEI